MGNSGAEDVVGLGCCNLAGLVVPGELEAVEFDLEDPFGRAGGQGIGPLVQ